MPYRPSYELREKIAEFSARIDKIESKRFKSSRDKELAAQLREERGNLQIELKGNEIEENELNYALQREKEDPQDPKPEPSGNSGRRRGRGWANERKRGKGQGQGYGD
jgi:hypothetical protein